MGIEEKCLSYIIFTTNLGFDFVIYNHKFVFSTGASMCSNVESRILNSFIMVSFV